MRPFAVFADWSRCDGANFEGSSDTGCNNDGTRVVIKSGHCQQSLALPTGNPDQQSSGSRRHVKRTSMQQARPPQRRTPKTAATPPIVNTVQVPFPGVLAENIDVEFPTIAQSMTPGTPVQQRRSILTTDNLRQPPTPAPRIRTD
ncbi:hypothetical protein HPB48_023646 [Haemaphysalis longicornis]|uniref:Uncharacterized protein n=1 Tax=Haemaphysalis longicornis TaxID=44386 RepID=A0A9J6H7J6_HAELO|nr:hypothetical protein HPB48_023646 [Haemaphysalis longicornis]